VHFLKRNGKCEEAKYGGPIYHCPSVVGQLYSFPVMNAVRNAVTVAEVTSTIRGIPVEVNLGPEDGLPKKCVVNLDTIVTIRKPLLIERITILGNEKIEQINAALKFALSIP